MKAVARWSQGLIKKQKGWKHESTRPLLTGRVFLWKNVILNCGGELMKCPNDQTEMDKGSLIGGKMWLKIDENNFWQKIDRKVVDMSRRVFAWRCPSCGKVELSTEIKK
jgi:hypothetical protein